MKKLIIVEEQVIKSLFFDSVDNIIPDVYAEIYIPPDIYDYFAKTVKLEDLKIFTDVYKKIDFDASRIAINSIIDQDPIISRGEAAAMIYAMTKKSSEQIDILMDDIRKAKIFKSRSLNVIRLSDIVTSAADFKNEDKESYG